MSTAPVSHTEHVVDVAGRSVRVQVQGDGPPLLLINGLGANISMWAPLLPELADFTVISFDAPGTGRSPAPFRPYTLAHVANVAVRVLDALGLDAVDVLGYSLGGGVAQQLAHDHPDRVRRLVLVSTSCGAGSVPGSLVALMAVMTPARHHARAGYRVAMNMVNLAPAEKESDFLRRQTDGWHHGSPPSTRGYMLQMTAFSLFNSLPWLHRVKQPTLLLSGSHDRIIPMANSAVLAAYLPRARLRIVDRWGHYLLHDAASGAGRHIADFLSAEDHTTSEAWTGARSVDQEEMRKLVRASPRSAHYTQYTNGFVRRMYPIQDEGE
ncbi:hypothetical protein ASG49_00375 [Marmoricola sp. Leaf446]|uniref:alpha/beta fold hydrolase n=1 Tax=Marmoricola sp. Leaf446 TaxID=1736379 RepID=UPI0006F955EF|nr:alpha/beta hydrolase [Marmoricola sp. Leaf446]KQT93512.1 hypothetical protein ASG49_00375 [Marmoricola sp. Leaf446]